MPVITMQDSQFIQSLGGRPVVHEHEHEKCLRIILREPIYCLFLMLFEPLRECCVIILSSLAYISTPMNTAVNAVSTHHDTSQVGLEEASSNRMNNK